MGELEERSAFELRLREERAERYDEEYVATHGSWFSSVELGVIRRHLRLIPRDVLLDLGCGTGRLTVELAPLVQRVIAVDRSATSLDILRERLAARRILNVSLVESDASQLAAVKETVTKALSVQLLQHLPSRESRRQALRSVVRILEPGGKVAVIDEAHSLLRKVRGRVREIADHDQLYFHPFEPAELREDLESVGLAGVQVYGCGVLYWTRYRFAPRAVVAADVLLSVIPPASRLAKFLLGTGEKEA